MAVPVKFLLPLLEQLLGDASRKWIADRMERAEALIVAGMVAKGTMPPAASVAVCSRDALFRLWKTVVGSGDIADLIRDAQAPYVVRRVEADLAPDADLRQIVAATREEALVVAFEGRG